MPTVPPVSSVKRKLDKVPNNEDVSAASTTRQTQLSQFILTLKGVDIKRQSAIAASALIRAVALLGIAAGFSTVGRVRSFRIEFPGAVYQVMARGDRREPIFDDDKDRLGARGQALPLV